MTSTGSIQSFTTNDNQDVLTASTSRKIFSTEQGETLGLHFGDHSGIVLKQPGPGETFPEGTSSADFQYKVQRVGSTDDMTVELSVNGTVVQTSTQTVDSTDYSSTESVTGGGNTYSVTVTDQSGNTDESQQTSFEVEVPDPKPLTDSDGQPIATGSGVVTG